VGGYATLGGSEIWLEDRFYGWMRSEENERFVLELKLKIFVENGEENNFSVFERQIGM